MPEVRIEGIERDFPIVDTGQLTATELTAIKKAQRQGKVVKYEDFTFPKTKTGYALARPVVSAERQSIEESLRSLREGVWTRIPQTVAEVETRLTKQLEALEPPAVEVAKIELYKTTRGFEEDATLRADLETKQGYKLHAVFETPTAARGAARELVGQDIRFVKHISTTGVKTWEVYAKPSTLAVRKSYGGRDEARSIKPLKPDISGRSVRITPKRPRIS